MNVVAAVRVSRAMGSQNDEGRDPEGGHHGEHHEQRVLGQAQARRQASRLPSRPPEPHRAEDRAQRADPAAEDPPQQERDDDGDQREGEPGQPEAAGKHGHKGGQGVETKEEAAGRSRPAVLDGGEQQVHEEGERDPLCGATRPAQPRPGGAPPRVGLRRRAHGLTNERVASPHTSYERLDTRKLRV